LKTNRNSGELTLAINSSSKLSLRFHGSFLVPRTDDTLEDALFSGEGTGGVELACGGGLVWVLLVSSCLGSSGFWLATVALEICGLGDDLLAAWLALLVLMTGAFGLAQLTEEGKAEASVLPFLLSGSSLLLCLTIGWDEDVDEAVEGGTGWICRVDGWY
jgi:hypothetical protein